MKVPVRFALGRTLESHVVRGEPSEFGAAEPQNAEPDSAIRYYRAIDLHDVPVTGPGGRLLGRIDHLVLGQDGQMYAVVEKTPTDGDARFFALPLSLLVARHGHLATMGLSPDQIDAVPPHDALDARFAIAHGDTLVAIRRAMTAAEAASDPAGPSRELRERIGLTASPDQAIRWSATRAMRVSELKLLYVHNTSGEMLGGIERVLLHESKDRRYVLLGPGGVLALFDEVAVPVDRLLLRRDRLLLVHLSDDELDEIAEWRTRLLPYRELQPDDWVAVGFQE